MIMRILNNAITHSYLDARNLEFVKKISNEVVLAWYVYVFYGRPIGTT